MLGFEKTRLCASEYMWFWCHHALQYIPKFEDLRICAAAIRFWRYVIFGTVYEDLCRHLSYLKIEPPPSGSDNMLFCATMHYIPGLTTLVSVPPPSGSDLALRHHALCTLYSRTIHSQVFRVFIYLNPIMLAVFLGVAAVIPEF
jgi:hypothetical protein